VCVLVFTRLSEGADLPIRAWAAAAPDTDAGLDPVALIGAVFAGISALAVVIGAVYWLMKRRERAARAAREEQVSSDVAEMGDSIEHLESVVAALAEEMRGRTPQPLVRFLLSEGPSPGALAVKPSVPLVDIDAIVESERQAALSTLIPVEVPRPSSPTRQGETAIDISTLETLEKLTKPARAFGFGQKHLPVTEQDHDAFKAEVERYASDLRGFIDDWLAYLAASRLILLLHVQIDNDGGAPADEARIKLHFPDPCSKAAWPDKPERPKRPKFVRRESPFSRLGRDYPLPYLPPVTPRFEPPNVNLTGPFYEEGSVVVRYDYRSIPHHDPVKPDPFLIAIPEPGAFEVRWAVGAKNLSRPAEGILHLEVRHEEPDPSVRMTNLVDLLSAHRARG
jgi:hypothetical protein